MKRVIKVTKLQSQPFWSRTEGNEKNAEMREEGKADERE